ARGSQCPGLSSAGQTFLSLECYSEQSAAPVALYNLRSPAAVSVFFGFVACRNTLQTEQVESHQFDIIKNQFDIIKRLHLRHVCCALSSKQKQEFGVGMNTLSVV